MNTTSLILLIALLFALASSAVCSAAQPPTEAPAALYISNRAPLAPSPFMKLPIGSIIPKGWLRHMLELERDGMIGHLAEISKWCQFDGNAWTSPEGTGHSGWEELPYWLKGYGDLGYVLKDEAIIKETKRWVDAVLSSQREDGFFGPRALITGIDKTKPDLWPHMVMLNVLQSYQEATGDPRIVPFMSRYFKWELAIPEDQFLAGYWPKMRAGDNIESVFWVYNRTGEPWLLDLAAKLHRNAAPWAKGVANWHGVNFCQGFREPAVYWMVAKDDALLQAAERNHATAIDLYGQVPGGMFGADENARPGFGDPRQGAETCSIVEFMHSFQMLSKITGNPLWADRCEEVAFNSFPASMTPDQKALHYITCPNVIQLDRGNKNPGLQNRGMLLAYSPGAAFRCCQHNVSHGWPYYADELWLATPDNGLAASLYAASEVTAKVADGAIVTIAEETDYPFDPKITFRITTASPVKFPLHLRIPRWCNDARITVNGQAQTINAKPLTFAIIDRQWASGDTVTLELPMKLSVRRWEKNKNSASIDYGPLTFSLKIGERWQSFGSNQTWPDWEVFPTGRWNYGLVLDEKDPASSFEIIRKPGPIASQPFTPDAAPIELRAKGKCIPGWVSDKLGLVGLLQQSPAISGLPAETITLIPMGAARLRISAFPVIGTGESAHLWTAPAPATQPAPTR